MYQRAPCTLIYTLNVLMKCDVVYLVSVDCSIREYFMIYYLLCVTLTKLTVLLESISWCIIDIKQQS